MFKQHCDHSKNVQFISHNARAAGSRPRDQLSLVCPPAVKYNVNFTSDQRCQSIDLKKMEFLFCKRYAILSRWKLQCLLLCHFRHWIWAKKKNENSYFGESLSRELQKNVLNLDRCQGGTPLSFQSTTMEPHCSNRLRKSGLWTPTPAGPGNIGHRSKCLKILAVLW